jgi:hypothetical protein
MQLRTLRVKYGQYRIAYLLAYGGAVTTPLQPHRGTCGQLRRLPIWYGLLQSRRPAWAAAGSSNPRRSRPTLDSMVRQVLDFKRCNFALAVQRVRTV